MIQLLFFPFGSDGFGRCFEVEQEADDGGLVGRGGIVERITQRRALESGGVAAQVEQLVFDGISADGKQGGMVEPAIEISRQGFGCGDSLAPAFKQKQIAFFH